MSDADPRPPGGLPREVADAARALRAEVPMRAEWRDALLREVDALPPPARGAPAVRWTGRALVLRPAVGVAAAAACLALGAAGGRLLVPRAPAPRPAAAGAAGIDAAGRPGAAATVRFVLVAPGAARVALVGDFNRWNAAATPMRAAGDGRTWVAQLPLAPGRHVYAFVVDGDLVADPAAPRAADDDFGIPSSVVLVGRPST